MSSSAVNGHEAAAAVKPPRLPRWTRQEILVLIEAKRVVESRGRTSRAGLMSRSGPVGSSNPVEPKWAAVSTYCKRHGVNRGPVQCRKRWSNLAGDYKKIKEWESSNNERESFWVMRNDLRREKRLPGFFDKEVYDILGGGLEEKVVDMEEEEELKEEEVVFDSGRTAAEDGLFSDGEGEEETPAELVVVERVAAAAATEVEVVTPISEKKLEASRQECSDSGMQKGKQPVENPERGPSSSSQEERKRRRTSEERYEESNLQSQLIEVLERNSRMLTAQLEAQNVSNQLDREQRKEQTEGLLGVLTKVADALGRIADKL